MFRIWALILVSIGSISSIGGVAWAEDAIPITILHTNDLHSHFRPERTALGLGGIARLKTAIDRVRHDDPGALLVDGGDWSEGNVYYREGFGTEVLRMMGFMGYDVAVIGNHDWLNGPDTLLKAIEGASTRIDLVGANLDFRDYSQASDFGRVVMPYVIKEVKGVKIAFIGLLTYERIYDGYLLPIRLVDPVKMIGPLAEQLKQQADVVVAISHNRIKKNEAILQAAPALDLIIGAHDHIKLSHPVVVQRAGAKPGWIVETGCWGRYLGRVDLKVVPGKGSVELAGYRLIQMDSSIPDDPETDTRLEALEGRIEAHMGAVFHDQAAESRMELDRGGRETLIGDFATDSYRRAVPSADFAMDERNFLYGDLHEGMLRTVDFFNANPAVFSPSTGKSWTLKTFPMSGRMLKWILAIFFASDTPAQSNALQLSGVQVIYDPFFQTRTPKEWWETPDTATASAPFSFPSNLTGWLDSVTEGTGIHQILVNGKDLDPNETYTVVAGGGIIESIRFLDSYAPFLFPQDEIHDTGIESWRAMLDYGRMLSPITRDKVAYGDRLRTQKPDLGVLHDDITWEPQERTPQGVRAKVRVNVRNFGVSPSPANGAAVHLLLNSHGSDYSDLPDYREAVPAEPIRSLGPDETQSFEWILTIPESRGLYPLTVRITGTDDELVQSNDEVIRYFAAPQEPQHPLR